MNKITKRIMIVGCPRSGTTLLQGLLSAHPDITSFVESHFFDFGVRNPRSLGYYYIAKNAPRLIEKFLNYTQASNELKEKIFNGMPKQPTAPGIGVKKWAKYFISIFDEIAIERGRSLWVEKTPDHLNRIELINKYIPDMQFIHIFRDGGDTIASLFNASIQWKKNYTIDQCINYWNQAIMKTIERKIISTDIFIYYKKLVENPDLVICNIFHKLNLSGDFNLIQNFKESIETIISVDETWKRKNLKSIEYQSTFDSTFSKKQQEYILQNINQNKFEGLIEETT